MNGLEIMPFGKYKGQPVNVLQSDPSYCKWLMSQDWFRERYGGINVLIVNNFTQPDETPEHNALQAKFLDDEFVEKFVQHFILKDTVNGVEGEMNSVECCLDSFEKAERYCADTGTKLDTYWVAPYVRDYSCEIYYVNDFHPASPSCSGVRPCSRHCHCFKNLSEGFSDYPKVTKRTFESHGIDVCLFNASYRKKREHGRDFAIEVKPSMGDDYPAILRQVKTRSQSMCKQYGVIYEEVVMYDKFTATGATLAQVQKIFGESGISLISYEEIESTTLERLSDHIPGYEAFMKKYGGDNDED